MSKSNKAISDAIALSIRERILQKVNAAAALFETRWTMDALRRHAPDLHDAIEEQQSMFHESLTTGDDAEITRQGEAMCRGWAVAIETMEKSGIAHDAYHIGTFGDVTVAIGRQHHAPDWFIEQHGSGVAWLNAREVAAMYFQIREVENVKMLWPDAKIVGVRSKKDAT